MKIVNKENLKNEFVTMQIYRINLILDEHGFYERLN